ncbi:hypothetical protein KAI87_10655 [Myxococcota bacterium]|nr:hypothetical protein [Myxococcota bacterium]
MAFGIGGVDNLKQVTENAKAPNSEAGTKLSTNEKRAIVKAYDDVGFLSKPDAAGYMRDNIDAGLWDKMRRSHFIVD